MLQAVNFNSLFQAALAAAKNTLYNSGPQTYNINCRHSGDKQELCKECLFIWQIYKSYKLFDMDNTELRVSDLYHWRACRFCYCSATDEFIFNISVRSDQTIYKPACKNCIHKFGPKFDIKWDKTDLSMDFALNFLFTTSGSSVLRFSN